MSHARDIDSFLKKSGSESLSYKKFPSERASQESPWSIIDSVAGAKSVPAQAPRGEDESVSITRPAGYLTQREFEPRPNPQQAPESARSSSGPQAPVSEHGQEQKVGQDVGQRFGHLFRQAADTTESPVQGTPLKALLQRIAL